MRTAAIQGDLWNQAPRDWATLLEPMHRPLWEAMLDAALVRSGTRFLDAGCGGGGASVLAAARGALVSGLDAAAGMVQIARARLPAGDFRVGDMEHLPYPDEHFDAVFAANAIQYAADWVGTLREFGRVCRPGGRIVAGLFGPPDKVAFSTVWAAIRNTLPQPPPGAGPFELSLPGKLESLFTEAGLDLLQNGEVDCPFIYPDFETFWQAHSSAGPFQSALRAASKGALLVALRQAIKPYRVAGGAIHIQPNIFRVVVAASGTRDI